MIRFFEIVAANVAVASLLAIIAWGAGRWLKRPALAHGLWVLVLAKLITPPLIALPMFSSEPPKSPPLAAAEPVLPVLVVPDEKEAVLAAWRIEWDNDWLEPALAPIEEAPTTLPMPERVAVVPLVPEQSIDWLNASFIAIAALWAFGSIAWIALATIRFCRFARWMRHADRAPSDLQARVSEWAARLGVSAPETLLVPGLVSPMLWVRGRTPRLILPAELLSRLAGPQGDSLLLHELAHWKRGDHWIRRLEIFVVALYWWCPLAWWAKARIEECEEECCDAWVVSMLPDAARDYALALVETLDFLAGACPALPPSASGLGRLTSLQRRLTMIVCGPFPRALTFGGVALLLGVGALLLPLAPSRAQTPKLQDQVDKALANLNQDDPAPPRKEGRKDGDEPRKGPRDGERPKKGPRDGDGPREGERKEGERKEGDRKGGERKEGKGPNPDLQAIQAKLREMEAEIERSRMELEAKMRAMMELRRRMHQFEAEGGPEGKGIRFNIVGGPNPDMERRMNELERKLDMILRAINRDGGPIPPMPPMPPRERKEGNPPPPRKEGERRDGAVELEINFAVPPAAGRR